MTDEKSFAVKIDVDPIDVGFLITLICANLVSVGKSFVESSNLAYTNIYKFLILYTNQTHDLLMVG